MSGPHLDFPFDPQRPAASLVRPDHPALHAPTASVATFDAALARCLDRLIAVCDAADGVGIAATQVGLGAAIAIVWPPAPERGAARPAPIELVNPRLIEADGERIYEIEGCLSLPCLHGVEVRRPERVRVEATDRAGRRFVLEAAGFVAEIVSHEIDHLEGLLYPERATRLVWSPAFRVPGAH